MQRKTIEETIKRKFENWVNSIEDVRIKNLVRNNTIITGGCIASMLLKEDVNDFDVYFTNKETVKAVAEYYVDIFNKNNKDRKNNFQYNHKAFVLDGAFPIEDQIFKIEGRIWKSKMLEKIPDDRIKIIVRSDGIAEDEEFKKSKRGNFFVNLLSSADRLKASEIQNIKNKEEEKEKYKPVFLSTNAITLSDKIQIIVRFYGDANKIHENFDFIHCTNYWKSSDQKLYTNIDALESILAKNLVYHGSKYPLCSVIRTRKFLKRDWHINAGQYLKMCFQIGELDLKDINVLEEQLIGVDTMYFMEIINILRENSKENSDFTIDSSYVSTIVDKVFG